MGTAGEATWDILNLAEFTFWFKLLRLTKESLVKQALKGNHKSEFTRNRRRSVWLELLCSLIGHLY